MHLSPNILKWQQVEKKQGQSINKQLSLIRCALKVSVACHLSWRGLQSNYPFHKQIKRVRIVPTGLITCLVQAFGLE